MTNVMKALYNIRLLDEFAEKGTAIHRLNPMTKLLLTMIYITFVVSFGKYEISRLLPMALYPVIMVSLADIPVIPILKRMLVAVPFVIGIGIFNPIFDTTPVTVLEGFHISGGWISFLSILFRCALTVIAAIILITTTGMTRIAAALRALRIPRIFVMQLLLTYRYVTVMMEEVVRILRAYSMRDPYQRGVRFSAWGSLAGQLLIRTYERAQSVYQSMCCRGFEGEYNTGSSCRMGIKDFAYITVWTLYFVTARSYDIPAFLGSVITGVGI